MQISVISDQKSVVHLPMPKQNKKKAKPAKIKTAAKPLRHFRTVKKTQRKAAPKPIKIKNSHAKPKQNLTLPKLTAPFVMPKRELTAPQIKMRRTKISRHLLDLKSAAQAKEKVPAAKKIKQTLPLKTVKKSSFSQLGSKIKGLNQAAAKVLTLPKIKLPAVKAENKTAAISKHDTAKPLHSKIEFKDFKLGNLILPATWLKAAAAFVSICILVILPFSAYSSYQKLQHKKVDVLAKAGQALWHLAVSEKAAAAKDLPDVQNQLQQSAANFSQAKADLDDINILIKGLITLIPNTNKQFNSADNLLEAGQKLADSAAQMTAALSQLKFDKSLANLNLTNNLQLLKDHLNLILPDLETASENLGQISVADLPAEYQDKIQTIKTGLPTLTSNVKDFLSVSDLLLKILGSDSVKRYLILFQNNNEIRPTGGFIGSYALVDIDRGNITKIDVPGGGPYDLKGSLKETIESPLPLHLVNARWEFQDANWFADLPASADKLNLLFEKSGGPSVDGLVFVNASLMQKILAITGPIDLPQYQQTITADNFIDVVQKEVELDYDKTGNRPKKIIADLTPILLDKILASDPKQLIQFLNLFLESLNQKEIQFYFKDFDLEQFVSDHNWAGRLADTSSDYLDVVSTNIAGEKTDAKIKQSAILNVQIQPDGSVIDNLTITKTHSGLNGEPFYGVPNLDYLRIYVPQGSELIKAEGFDQIPPEFFLVANHDTFSKDPDISQIETTKNVDPLSATDILTEGNKTVFGNWMRVEPGETKTVSLSYKLPFKINMQSAPKNLDLWQKIKSTLGVNDDINPDSKTYSLLWQKQSGKRDFVIHVTINLPENLKSEYSYPENLKINGNTYSFTTELDSDQLLALIFNQ